MANEITLKAQLKAAKGGANVDSTLHQKLLDLTGNDMIATTQLVGTSADEALALGEVTTPGQLLVLNMDATNSVELGFTTGGAWAARVKIRAGCWAFFEPVGTVYAKANTADVRVQVWAVAV